MVVRSLGTTKTLETLVRIQFAPQDSWIDSISSLFYLTIISMKRFIAIALIGLFSCVMVGSVVTSLNKDVPGITVKKDFDSKHFDVAILDGQTTPSVNPNYGKLVTVLSEDVLLTGYSPEINPSTNSPPTIRKL